MQIETAKRLQRLERCVELIQSSGETDGTKAESLSYIAGYTALLKGVEADGATDDESDVVAAIVNIDEFCDLVEQTAAQEA
ncbi:hypothetical protein [Pseudomonas aeruginosa]|uniref:hypothetical protein n=1 Tax=Pseudomonas aeruginosa TaxID=287 RepID=UPI000939C9A4|nr:hypothetical protein [Pseudomonas aeruginosa]